MILLEAEDTADGGSNDKMSMRRIFIRLIVIALFFSPGAYGFSSPAESSEIVLTLWNELDKIPSSIDSSGKKLQSDEIVKNTLEDARWILSGMIYGFNVRYVPLDSERKVNEIFTVKPIAAVPFGDSSLRVYKTWTTEQKFFVQIRYELKDFERRRIRAWGSNIFPSSEGRGKASLFEGPGGRLDSVRDGIKLALRNYLRKRIKNKPREIRCKVIIDQPPYIIINAGGYYATVKIKFSLDAVTPYMIY